MAFFMKKRSYSLPLVINAGVSSLILALGMTPTFGAFTASISGNANNVAAGVIVMQETNSAGTTTCLSSDGDGLAVNAASCSSIGYAGSGVRTPGDSVSVVTFIRNVGTVAASAFSLVPGTCVQSAAGSAPGSATDLCSRITVTITSGSSTIFTGTAASLSSAGAIDLLTKLGFPKIQPGTQIPITVTTSLDAAMGNSYQNLALSQPMTWTFSA
jgi:hypothetical protein